MGMRTDERFEQTLKINAMVLSVGITCLTSLECRLLAPAGYSYPQFFFRAMHGSVIALSLWEVCGLDVGRR